MWRCDNVGGLGKHIKNTCCGFLGIPFLLYSSARAERANVDRFWRSISHTTCFRPKDVPFGGLVHIAPHFGGKIHKNHILGAWIGYRNYCTDYNQILHSDKDHHILFVGCPNTRKTNPRWRTAAILKNRKSAISLERFDRSLRNLVRWRTLGLWTGPEVNIFKFSKSKVANGGHVEKWNGGFYNEEKLKPVFVFISNIIGTNISALLIQNTV